MDWDKVRKALAYVVGKVLPDAMEKEIVNEVSGKENNSPEAKEIVNEVFGKENNSPEAKEIARLKAQIAAQKERNRLAQEKLLELAAERKKAEDLKATAQTDQNAEDAANECIFPVDDACADGSTLSLNGCCVVLEGSSEP